MRAQGTLFGVRFAVIDLRGDIGGLCADLGNTEGSSATPDVIEIYSNMSHELC